MQNFDSSLSHSDALIVGLCAMAILKVENIILCDPVSVINAL